VAQPASGCQEDRAELIRVVAAAMENVLSTK
jgi:hypothetical protein